MSQFGERIFSSVTDKLSFIIIGHFIAYHRSNWSPISDYLSPESYHMYNLSFITCYHISRLILFSIFCCLNNVMKRINAFDATYKN